MWASNTRKKNDTPVQKFCTGNKCNSIFIDAVMGYLYKLLYFSILAVILILYIHMYSYFRSSEVPNDRGNERKETM